VRELTHGRGADVLFEFAGSAHAFGEGVEMAAAKASRRQARA
jgi:threonine dehydrogenase-like Zn-dependent dehydrogenase